MRKDKCTDMRANSTEKTIPTKERKCFVQCIILNTEVIYSLRSWRKTSIRVNSKQDSTRHRATAYVIVTQ